MKTLSIDIEAYSDVALPKTDMYRYCESPDFEILLFGYSVDSDPVQVVDLACGEAIPEEIISALEDETVIKYFCQPCAATKSNGGRTSNRPFHSPKKWSSSVRV